MKPIDPRALWRLTKPTVKKPARSLLGLDVGTKYVAISYSEPGNRTAWPVTVLERSHGDNNIADMAYDFNQLFKYYGAAGMVIGHPYYCGRLHNKSTIRDFVHVLYNNGRLSEPYTFWDECYTSKIYAQMVKPLQFDPSEAKTINDKFAVVAILQAYLDFMNRKY